MILKRHFLILQNISIHSTLRYTQDVGCWTTFLTMSLSIPVTRSNGRTRKLQFDALDRLCHEASSDPSTLVVATDASVIPPRNMQAVSVAHFWRLGEQVSSSKAPAGQATALDAELFAIRLGVVKATSFDVKRIIIITDSLTAARRAVDASVRCALDSPSVICW